MLSFSAFSQNNPVENTKETAKISKAIPDDVNAVLANSCFQCHSNDGSGMARAKMNLSEWDSYDADKKATKAGAMCNEIIKDMMPPKRFLSSNPSAALSGEQKELICKWSESLAANK